MKVSVIGTGYVGLITGLCFAKANGNITCLDLDTTKIEKLNKGEPTIYEIGLNELLKSCLSKRLIKFTSNYDDIVDNDIYFIAVGTPPATNGQADLRYVYSAIDMIVSMKQKTDNFIIVLKSTVEVGTANKLKETYKDYVNLKIVNNPEFLREGTAIEDFTNPDRVIIGSDDEDAEKEIKKLYDKVFGKNYVEFLFTDNTTAEMIKYASNSFLATKISFINEMALLCDKVNANIIDVELGMSMDKRIGRSFLKAGCGYGGSCFPKDVKALKHIGIMNGLSMNVTEATENTNREMKEYLAIKILNHFNGDIKGKSFAVWGLAFKPGTDDVREAPSINVIANLAMRGAILNVYDPQASENFKKVIKEDWLENINFCNSKEDAIKQSKNGLVILTEWKEFYRINNSTFKLIRKSFDNLIIFDGRNMLRGEFPSDFKYFGIGINK